MDTRNREYSGNTLEHRLHKRTPVKYNADIYIDNNFIVRGKAANISQTGIFIEFDKQLLPNGGVVDLVFNMPNGNKIISHAFRCLAIHCTDKGVGFIFFKTHSDIKSVINHLSEVA